MLSVLAPPARGFNHWDGRVPSGLALLLMLGATAILWAVVGFLGVLLFEFLLP